jgi:hypothetical protein
MVCDAAKSRERFFEVLLLSGGSELMSRNFKDEMKRIADEKNQRELEAQRERQRKMEEERLAKERDEAERQSRVRWMEENLKPYLEEINKTFLEGKGKVVVDKYVWSVIVKWDLYIKTITRSDNDSFEEHGKKIRLDKNWESNTVEVSTGDHGSVTRFGSVNLSNAIWRDDLEVLLIKAVESGEFDF